MPGGWIQGGERGGERTLLSRGALGLGGEAVPDLAVLRIVLLQSLGGIVDETKAGGLAATKLGSQTEDGDLVLLGLVEGGELVAQLILGDVGSAGVEDVTRRKNMLVSQTKRIYRGFIMHDSIVSAS